MSKGDFSECTWQIAQNVFRILNAQDLSASSCSANSQQFGGTDAGESPICATDGALRAVASPSPYFHQNILEALRSVAWNNEEHILCNLPKPTRKTTFNLTILLNESLKGASLCYT